MFVNIYRYNSGSGSEWPSVNGILFPWGPEGAAGGHVQLISRDIGESSDWGGASMAVLVPKGSPRLLPEVIDRAGGGSRGEQL